MENLNTLMLVLLVSIITIISIAVTLWFLVWVFILWLRNRHRESESFNSTLLQVTVPRDNEIKIDAAEQMFSSFAALYSESKVSWLEFLNPQVHISFEIVGLPGDIRFYVFTPNKYRDFVEKQINGAYSDAEIVPVNEITAKQNASNVIGTEYNIFSEQGKVAFASLKQKNYDYIPIKVYKEFPIDTLSSITSVLAKMGEGEGATIQILVRPAGSHWKKAGRGYISTTKKNEADPKTAKYGTDTKELELIENAISKPGFDVVIRIVVSSKTKAEAEAHLKNIVNAFGQFSGQNSFTENTHQIKGWFMKDFIYRYFPIKGQSSVLTSEELATIFHFPNKSVATHGIHWLTSKRAPAPSNLPTSGLYLGRSAFRGMNRPVYIERDDRRRHMYIIGKTGTGKTEFLKSMIMQDIHAGEGLAVIDPHGDLVEDILLQMPAKRAEEVILFDPSDLDRPMGFNMLDAQTEQQKHFVVNSVIGLMYKLFDPNKIGRAHV